MYRAEHVATKALIDFYRASGRGKFDTTVDAVKRFARADARRFALRDQMRAESTLQPSELRKWMNGEKNYILIDVLPEQIYEKRRLPGALNACVYEVSFPDQVAAITEDKSEEIVLYGSSAQSRDAIEALEKLLRLGYENVHVFNGGVDGWLKSGHPIEGENIEPPERLGPAVDFQDHFYTVNTDESVIGWTGRNKNGKHCGTLKLSKGEIQVRDGAIQGTLFTFIYSCPVKDGYATAAWVMYPCFFNAFIQRGVLCWTIRA